MSEAYKERKWGFVPDYARFDIIYNHGGFYLDTDVELFWYGYARNGRGSYSEKDGKH